MSLQVLDKQIDAVEGVLPQSVYELQQMKYQLNRANKLAEDQVKVALQHFEETDNQANIAEHNLQMGRQEAAMILHDLDVHLPLIQDCYSLGCERKEGISDEADYESGL